MATFNPPGAGLSPRGTYSQFVYPHAQMISTRGRPYAPRVPGIAYYPLPPSTSYVYRPTTMPLATGRPSIGQAGIGQGRPTSGGGTRPGLLSLPGTVVGGVVGVVGSMIGAVTGRRPGGGYRQPLLNIHTGRVLPFARGGAGSASAAVGVSAPGAVSASNGPAEGSGGGGGGGSGDMPAGGSSGEGAIAAATWWETAPLWQKALGLAAFVGGVYYGYRWYTGRKSASTSTTTALANPRKRRRLSKKLKAMGVRREGKGFAWGGLK